MVLVYIIHHRGRLAPSLFRLRPRLIASSIEQLFVSPVLERGEIELCPRR